MLKVSENSLLAGVSELRYKIASVLSEAKTSPVILTNRNRPVAVLLDYEEYKRTDSILEALEDLVLGHLAQQRDLRKHKKLVSLEEAQRRVGLKKQA